MVSETKVNLILTYCAAFLLSYAGVKVFRKWSLQRALLDIPNERSSHREPTPRGGGIVIAGVVLLFGLAGKLTGYYEINSIFFAACGLIVLISWIDDLISVSFIWRLLVHSAAALLVIFYLGHFETIALPFYGKTELGWFGLFLTFAWIVWMTNAYNFMDGIDGIAGLQAVIAGIGWFLAAGYWELGFSMFYGGLIAVAAGGFLIHNWQPAKIFMGDVGSAFLGFSFAVIPFLSKPRTGTIESVLYYPAAAFVWLFFIDTIFTFLRRLTERKRVWEAHREHLYQRLVIENYSHRAVTSIYGIFSLVNVLTTVLFLYFEMNLLVYGAPLMVVQFLIIYFWVKKAETKN